MFILSSFAHPHTIPDVSLTFLRFKKIDLHIMHVDVTLKDCAAKPTRQLSMQCHLMNQSLLKLKIMIFVTF